jgi:hypothetical protein
MGGIFTKALSPEDDPQNDLYPYPYWDYEKQYLLAQVRLMEKSGVNSVRILLMRPFESCKWAIKNLSDSNVRKHWWSQDYPGWRGTVYNDIIPDDFQDPDYMASHWVMSNDDLENYLNIDRCWDRLLAFLIDLRMNFPNVKVVLSFTQGGEIMGALPVEKTFFEGDPKEFDQVFDNYYSGTNWLYFKTFYDQCMEKMDEINQDEENFPGADLDDINDLFTCLNIDFVEINNEWDGSCKKFDVESCYLYARPDDRNAIPDFIMIRMFSWQPLRSQV